MPLLCRSCVLPLAAERIGNLAAMKAEVDVLVAQGGSSSRLIIDITVVITVQVIVGNFTVVAPEVGRKVRGVVAYRDHRLPQLQWCPRRSYASGTPFPCFGASTSASESHYRCRRCCSRGYCWEQRVVRKGSARAQIMDCVEQ